MSHHHGDGAIEAKGGRVEVLKDVEVVHAVRLPMVEGGLEGEICGVLLGKGVAGVIQGVGSRSRVWGQDQGVGSRSVDH